MGAACSGRTKTQPSGWGRLGHKKKSMSVEAMNWAYQQTTGRSTAKAVLVALANQADESGKCWPSIPYLMERVEMGRTAVIGNLAFLEAGGFIKRTIRAGSGEGRKSNVYHLNMQCPESVHRGGNVRKADIGQCPDKSPKKGGNVRKTNPQCPESEPKQSINNQLKKNNQKNIGAPEEIPEWLDRETLTDFIEHRKQMKKPLTAVAMKRLIPNLERIHAQGHDPNECMERSIANGWQGIFPPDRSGKPSTQSKTGNDSFWESFQ